MITRTHATKCAGPDAYNVALWPPATDFWRERLALHAPNVSDCPTSVHNLEFWPADSAAEEVVRRAETEDAGAATAVAWSGKRRTFRTANMKFDFGPEVRTTSMLANDQHTHTGYEPAQCM